MLSPYRRWRRKECNFRFFSIPVQSQLSTDSSIGWVSVIQGDIPLTDKALETGVYSILVLHQAWKDEQHHWLWCRNWVTSLHKLQSLTCHQLQPGGNYEGVTKGPFISALQYDICFDYFGLYTTVFLPVLVPSLLTKPSPLRSSN